MIDINLIQFHRFLWDSTCPFAVKPNRRYDPERWIPHVTLGMEDVTGVNIGEIMEFLITKKYKYAFNIENITFVSRQVGQTLQIEKQFGINQRLLD
jgi:hypothetical protein